MLQETKEKLNKKIEETLNEISNKEEKIKKLDESIINVKQKFRGNQNIRGTDFLYKTNGGKLTHKNLNNKLATLQNH
jgi:DNA gyrase/topoisomerase IV subunit A